MYTTSDFAASHIYHQGVEDGEGSTGSSSPQREDDEDEEDDDIPKVLEMDTDIPLAKAGFNPIPSYPPIKVRHNPTSYDNTL